MTTIYLWNLTAYAVQLSALVIMALVAIWALRIRTPRHLLGFWQMVIAIALLIPFAQTYASHPAGLQLLSESLSPARDAVAPSPASLPSIDLAKAVLLIA